MTHMWAILFAFLMKEMNKLEERQIKEIWDSGNDLNQLIIILKSGVLIRNL